jgi:MFS family permease
MHLAQLNYDGQLLFASRIVRMFAYGFLSVIFGLYLHEVGLSESQAGLLITLTLLGDAAISLWLTIHADRVGRRRILIIGAGLMLLAGAVFSFADAFIILVLAATIGTISPSGNEVGPFLSVEQSALAQTLPDQIRTSMFAWYNLVGSFATASGALVSGFLAYYSQTHGLSTLASYRFNILIYSLLALLLIGFFSRLSARVEVESEAFPPHTQRWGLGHSRQIVLGLSALFALDAFAGGLIVQSLMAYWFHLKYGLAESTLGAIFFAANLLAGISALSAASLAKRIGLINTMVFTHLPSNILLMLVPLMPSLPLAIGVLLLRFSISQMDVPTRQSYVMAVVKPNERSAAAGITTIARSLGTAASPLLTGLLLSAALLNMPFFLAGGLKIVYDLSLYRRFKATIPPEERYERP